jgi:hypothetical protein
MHQFYCNIVSSEQAKQAKHCIPNSSQNNESSLSFSLHQCFSGVTEPITFKYSSRPGTAAGIETTIYCTVDETLKRSKIGDQDGNFQGRIFHPQFKFSHK